MAEPAALLQVGSIYANGLALDLHQHNGDHSCSKHTIKHSELYTSPILCALPSPQEVCRVSEYAVSFLSSVKEMVWRAG